MTDKRRGAVSAGRLPGRTDSGPPPPPPPSTVPDAPVLQGTAGNTQNSLSWTEPDDGGLPLITYTLERVAASTLAVASVVTGTASNSATCTVSGTGSGSERLLVVAIAHRDDVATRTVNSVTFNGDALSLVPSGAIARAAAFMGAELWYLIAPDVATGNIVVTMDSACGIDVCGIFFTGAHQSSPFGTAVSDDDIATDPSVVVASAVGEIVMDCFAGVTTGTVAVGPGQTQRANQVVSATGSGTNVRQGVSTEPGAASVTMSWIRDADHFALVAVPIKPASGSSTIYNQLAPRNYVDTGRTNGIQNDYRVKASNGLGDSAWSNTVSLTPGVPPATAPAKPTLTGTAGDRTVNIAASTSSDGGAPVTAWEFQMDSVTVQNTAQNVYSNTSLVNDTDYVFRVRATNSAGTSAWSDPLTLRPTAPVTPPATAPDPPVLSGTPGNGQNLLNWTVPYDGGDDLTEYELQRATASNFSGAVVILGNTLTTTHTDTGRTNGTPYYYRVRAINGTGTSNWSNTVSLTPAAPATAPDPPVLSGSAGNGSTSMTWTAPVNTGGSAIQLYELYDGFTLKYSALSPRAFSESGLPNGVDHNYWVRALNMAGLYSEPSNVLVLTPTAPSGAPSLPANTVVGRPASSTNYWGGYQLEFGDQNAYQVWKTQFGFNGFRRGSFFLDGYARAEPPHQGHNANDFRFRRGSALGAPYNADVSYDYQRMMEGAAVTDRFPFSPANAGPWGAKRADPTNLAFLGIKLHKVRDDANDLSPFGWAWSNDSGWADVATKLGDAAFVLNMIGADGFQFDPEFGDWEDGPVSGQTLAQQMTLIESRGYLVGKAIYEAFPNCKICFYGSIPRGAFHDEVVVRGQNASWGNYNGHSICNSSESWVSSNGQLMANIRHMQFYEGMWRAGRDFAGSGARWYFEDALFYRTSLGYPGTPGDTYALGARWNMWGIYSWLTRGGINGTLAASVRDWIVPRFDVTLCSWAGTDATDFYFSSQPTEPTFSDQMKAHRIYGMGGFKSEYGYGMDYPTHVADNTPIPLGNASVNNLQSTGRPRGGKIYGVNLYSGQAAGLSSKSGTLGNNPQGGGSPGQVINYGPSSAVAATPTDWTQRYVPPSSRRTGMLAAASTTPIPSSVPTLSNVSAVRQANGSVIVSCRARHPGGHAVHFVAVHRGSTFDKTNPAGSFLGIATAVFEPNNGTGLPPAGLSDPYMQCTYTTPTGFSVGQYLVIRARSTKEDDAWQAVPIT